MSFAIAGTVQEFLGSCVFIFIKHPYDVGDRVDINNVQLIIEHISLLYTIFRQVDSGASTQIPNIVNNGQWIKNISRSKAMTERYDFSVSAKTKFDAIENLKAELQSFSRDNKRDFQPTVDVELISLGNLNELVLRVEICHKVCHITSPHPYNHTAHTAIRQTGQMRRYVRLVATNSFVQF